jgi:hypothetical protein
MCFVKKVWDFFNYWRKSDAVEVSSKVALYNLYFST